MRFARLREKIDHYVSQIQALPHPVAMLRVLYNVLFWVFLLPFFTTIDDGIGFVLFAIVIVWRLIANLYANNIMPQNVENFERFPFRQPMSAAKAEPAA